jgi:CRP-like cAMP-binding protein
MTIQDPVQRLPRFPLFSGLSPEALRMIGSLAGEHAVRVQDVLFRQGDTPAVFHMMESGQILETGTWGGAPILQQHSSPGSVLARWSLFNEEPYQTTATVIQDAQVLTIDVADFQTLLNNFPVLRQRLGRSDAVARLLSIPLFSGFTEDQLFHVADLAEMAEYAPGEILFRQGEPGDAFYVIDTGRVVEESSSPGASSAWPKYFTAGNFFGRWSLLNTTTRRATAKAETRVKAFRFRADAFHWLRKLQPGFDRALARFDMLGMLAQVTIFSQLKEEDLKQLAGYVGLAHFQKDRAVVYQGEIDCTFYQLYEGEAEEIFKDERKKERSLRRLTAGQGAGERCLFYGEPWRFTLRSTQPANWLYLCGDDLNQFVLRRPDLKKALVPPDKLAVQAQHRAFDWMGLDEQERLTSRRHWFSLVDQLLGWPGMVWLAAGFLLAVLPWGTFVPALDFLHTVGWLFLGLRLLWCLVDWRNDYLMITTKRVLAREKVIGIFESLYEVPLGKVQNVGFRQNFVGNLLGFGPLTVDTAATSGVQPLTFTYARNPESIKALIFEEMERLQASRQPEAKRIIRERVDASTQPGLRPLVPKPVAPPSVPDAGRPKPGPIARAYGVTFGALFWVERKTEDQVTWRKHPLRLLVKVGLPTLIALSLIVVSVLLAPLLPLTLPVLLVLLLPLGFWWWFRFTDWGNDLYIVTRDRIIDTEKLPLGLRSRKTEAPFDRIQNVTYELPNLIANLFNYGTVSIFTAGVEGKLDFPYVARPRQVQAEIFRRLAAYEEEQRRKQQERTDLGDWFAAYEQTH